MYTYKIKLGDIARFPNGVEVNFDSVLDALVIKSDRVPVVEAIQEGGYWLLRFVEAADLDVVAP